MKIERHPDGTTIIKHFPLFISAMILLCVFVVFKTLVAPLFETPPRYDMLHVGIFALLFVFAFAHFMWERIRFEFDTRRRVIVWRRHRLFAGTTGGTIPFNEVTDVVTQTTSSDYSRLTRVALVTKEQFFPLMKVYGGNNKEVAQVIREVVGLDDLT